jgi:hypothetical protein
MSTKQSVVMVLVALLYATSGTRSVSSSSLEQEPSQQVTVVVRASSTPGKPVQGARVFWLSRDGHELDSAITDSAGLAHLREIGPAEQPRYLLVEADPYYVTGLPYFEGLREYLVLMTGAAVR